MAKDARRDSEKITAPPSKVPHPTKVDWHGGGKVVRENGKDK